MKFVEKSSDKASRAYFALAFLEEAYKQKMIYEIENIEEVFNALDISNDLIETTTKGIKENGN